MSKLASTSENKIHDLLYNTCDNTYNESINNLVDNEEKPKKLNSNDIEKVLLALYLSRNYIQRIWQNTENTISTLNQEIPRGIVMGYNANKLTKEIVKPKIEKALYNNIVRLVRTEYNRTFNQAILQSYESGKIPMYRIVAALEQHPSPCKFCQGLDYRNNIKPFRLKDAIPGVNYPPFHFNCRCIAEPYFKNAE